MGGFFEKNRDLPMYKDKPYSYVSSRKKRPIWKRKRIVGVVVSILMIVLYILGVFGDDAAAARKAKDSWNWLQRTESNSKIDWLGRRERVKEAFVLSWDAYERYAWGMSILLI
jgi:mannosyl-oligosaccharide alpha-1,2-mannosidase